MSSKTADLSTGRRLRKRRSYGHSQSMKQTSWSIKRRLTILYILSAFGILFASTIFLYWVLASHLQREDNQFLAAKIDLLRVVMLEKPNDQGVLEEEIRWESAPFRLAKYYARLLNSDKQTLIETQNMSSVVPVSEFPPPVGISQTPSEATKWKSKDGRSFLLMTALAKLGNSNDQTRILQLALDVSHENALISDYRRQLMLVLLAGILLSAVAGILVARKGLQPIEEITRTVQQVSASQLHERLGQSNWPLELNDLATAFDNMLNRLEDSFNRLSQFSADLAHELRTPINNLIGETEVALSRKRNEEDYRNVLESSLEEYSRLAHLIESLLFLARAENPEAHVERTQFDIRKQIEGLIEFYEAVAEEQGVEITCGGNATLNADLTLFRRALSNLLSNAIHHTPKGGNISVRVAQTSDSFVEVSVSDTGTGIDPKHIPQIFNRFYRADPSRSENKPGTGLGLAIVKSIMQLHDGTVSMESAPGKGTTVTLSFPA